MASNRIGRINEEIQRELSSLFRTLKDPRVQSGMVTITHVDTTSDLRYSRIYVSVLEKSLEKDVIRGLKSAAGYLRRELGANMSLPAPGTGPCPAAALHAGAAVHRGRLHRIRRAHLRDAARPARGEAREPRKRNTEHGG